jgi:hypothetical protein
LNVDRVFVGLAAPFNEPARPVDDGFRFSLDNLRAFIDSSMGLTLLWNHGMHLEPVVRRFGNYAAIASELRVGVGAARRFAAVRIDADLSGMLALGELDESATGDMLLVQITRKRITGLSLAGGFAEGRGDIQPTELSIVHEGAHPSARILGVGAEALSAWNLLTGEVYEHAR